MKLEQHIAWIRVQRAWKFFQSRTFILTLWYLYFSIHEIHIIIAPQSSLSQSKNKCHLISVSSGRFELDCITYVVPFHTFYDFSSFHFQILSSSPTCNCVVGSAIMKATTWENWINSAKVSKISQFPCSFINYRCTTTYWLKRFLFFFYLTPGK